MVSEISRCEPEDVMLLADDDRVDRICEAFARVVDAKSPWTFMHSIRVAEIAVGIASEFQGSTGFQQDIRRAALLHDIGKLGVSNAILDKQGKPTDEEYAQIKKHAFYSHEILRKVGAFKELARVAAGHHERLDGRGYHLGLAGAEISFATRILTVADVCEAMTAKRPYREALEWSEVLKILIRDSGHAFDPDCVSAARIWFEKHELASRIEGQLESVERLMQEI
jgi:putative nucleotidyltransferase with HDIG domain